MPLILPFVVWNICNNQQSALTQCASDLRDAGRKNLDSLQRCDMSAVCTSARWACLFVAICILEVSPCEVLVVLVEELRHWARKAHHGGGSVRFFLILVRS